ncbi:MAG: ABC transporter permease [Longimonas sp.]|uniref:ABC transporter permease n=1 Tax=Longimonas sp. TaxID=2039626 RepID=UPI003976BE3A
MFDGRAFQAWPLALLGATLIASLFLLVMMLMEAVLGGQALITRAGFGMAAAAFVGYLSVVRYLWWHDENRSSS